MGNLTLRLLEHRDLPLRVECINNPACNLTLNIKTPVTLEGTEAWFARVSKSTERADFAFEKDGEVVAFGGLTDVDHEVGKAELYIFVSPSKQNCGIGTDATKLICSYGFETLKLNKVYLHVNSDNLSARHIYEKCGFRMEGLMFREIIKNGKLNDRCYYAVYKSTGTTPLLKVKPSDQTSFFLCHDVKIAGRNLKIVRDDIFPGVGGGNKARKMTEYVRELSAGGFNAVVTTGGIQSNHNRAVALMAAQNGWQCHIVCHGSKERFLKEKGNATLIRATGASTEFVSADEISGAMDAAMARFREAGLKPYYITGGGHDLPGGNAYVHAAEQLFEFGNRVGYKPEIIFLASGTGSTQAGLLVGLEKVGWGDVKVVGISVARQRERGSQVIKEFATKLAREHGVSPESLDDKVHFSADYTCGGYEKTSDEMRKFLAEAILHSGIVFDTTYSGKALFGMNSILEKTKFHGRALFWHTGGIMNFLA